MNAQDKQQAVELRMSAYYYGFDKTGNPLIDRILSAVACAGKAFHRTEDWTEDAYPYDGHAGKSPVEWIQNAANDAAAALQSAPAAANAGGQDELRTLCAEMVELHAERGTVLTVHMEELARLLSRPTATSAAATPQDEREVFEKFAAAKGFPTQRLEDSGCYYNLHTSGAWDAWQARAALSHPAQRDDKDTERLNFLVEFGSTWSVQWEQRPGKQPRYRMIDDGDVCGKWHATPRAAIDAAMQSSSKGE